MFEYMSVKEAVEKWEISEHCIQKQCVQKLCVQNCIEKVARFGHTWAIPKASKKPADARKKSYRI